MSRTNEKGSLCQKEEAGVRMEIQEKVSEYIEALKAQKTARNTIEAYKRDLSQMADDLLAEQISDIESVKELTLKSYFWRMEQSGRRPATVARAVASAKAFSGIWKAAAMWQIIRRCG